MQIESARALKLEIAQEIVPPAVEAIRAAGGFSITSFAVHRVPHAEPLVALGVAPGNFKDDVKLAVRMQRHSLSQSQPLIEKIRKMSKNEVDMRFVGRVFKTALPWYRKRQRPLRPGISVGHYKITAGTIGAIAEHPGSGRHVILSNNHVLANENNAAIGDAIIQPGFADDGVRKSDGIAKLTDWVKLSPNKPNLLDVAVATIGAKIDFDPLTYRGIGKLAGVRIEPILSEIAVSKVGRTTGRTHGIVTAVELDDVVVDYDIGTLSFNDQIEIESTTAHAFSAGGDSGSLILDEKKMACALLFAGSEAGGRNGRGLTYANPIAPLIKRLAIVLPGS
jgi:hypothetical protein